MGEKFNIPVAALYGRLYKPEAGKADAPRKLNDATNGFAAKLFVLYYSALSESCAPDLELRLYKAYKSAPSDRQA
ncbi:MAG: hypothetical protein IKL79_04015 [Clostridia bacterium]|nr:hypothetical protein [Clostridia bacterium]